MHMVSTTLFYIYLLYSTKDEIIQTAKETVYFAYNCIYIVS